MTIDRLAIVPDGSTVIVNNMTGTGPAHTGTGDAVVSEAPYTYADWLKDPRNNAYRVFFWEIDHAAGTLGLASRGFLSKWHVPFYGWLTSPAMIESDLLSSKAIGDIEAVNPRAADDNWLNYEWHGYSCRGYHGDIRWDKEQFRLVSTSTIGDCQEIGERQYRFNLVGDVQKFNRPFHVGADIVKDQTVSTAIEWISGQWAGSGPVTFINFDDYEFNVPVLYEVTESCKMYDKMQAVAQSVGAYIRVSHVGELHVLKPDVDGEPAMTITNRNVAKDSIRQIGSIQAVKKVTIEYNNGASRVSGATLAQTGKLSEEVVVGTQLKNLADAQIRLAEEVLNYSKTRGTWSADLVTGSKTLHDGDYVEFQHDRVKGAGVVTRIADEPTGKTATIEVLI